MKNMKRLLMIAGFAAVLTACGNGETGNEGDSDADVSVGETGSTAAQTFQRNCISCHGDNLQGGAGPKLADVGSRLSKEEILKTIENGGNGMPAHIIEGKEAEDVAKWLSEKK